MKGNTLVELVIYIALIALLSVAVMNVSLATMKTFGVARVERTLASEGRTALSRLLYETRLANAINTDTSVFGSSPGFLSLATFMSPSDTTPTTREFFASGTALYIKDAGIDYPLTQKARLTSFTLYNISIATTSKSVSVSMTLEAGEGSYMRSENFYGTAVLRGSY